MSLETQGIKLFWRDIPGFCRDIPEAPEKFEKKMFGFNSRPLNEKIPIMNSQWPTQQIVVANSKEFTEAEKTNPMGRDLHATDASYRP